MKAAGTGQPGNDCPFFLPGNERRTIIAGGSQRKSDCPVNQDREAVCGSAAKIHEILSLTGKETGKQALFEQQLHLQEAHYETLINAHEQIRSIRHDIKNHIAYKNLFI